MLVDFFFSLRGGASAARAPILIFRFSRWLPSFQIFRRSFALSSDFRFSVSLVVLPPFLPLLISF